jgi:hypothetical protein
LGIWYTETTGRN